MDCKYPKCTKKATTAWALADLCSEHRELIKHESTSDDTHGRPEYMKIYEHTFHCKVKGRRKSY